MIVYDEEYKLDNGIKYRITWFTLMKDNLNSLLFSVTNDEQLKEIFEKHRVNYDSLRKEVVRYL